MDKEQRIKEVEELRKKIREKEIFISNNQKELNDLVNDLMIAQESVLPILLFTIDRSSPIAKKREILYVYYCPDFDTIRYSSVSVSKDEKEGFMPNTLDFRAYFKDLNMKEYQWPDLCYNFDVIVEKALFKIKKIWDNAYAINDFKSWDDASKYLEDVYINQADKELEDRVDTLLHGLSKKEINILRKKLTRS